MKIKFELDPFEAERDMHKKSIDSRYYLYSKRNINQLLIDDIKNRFRRGKNVICSFNGFPGTGKSYGGISLYWFITRVIKKTLKMSVAFDPDNVVFSNEEMLERMKTLQQGDTLVRDEQLHSDSVGIGGGRSRIEIEGIEETMRKRQTNFIWISPETRTHLHNYIFTTYGINYKYNVSRFLVFDPNMMLLGYITLKKPPASFIAKYEIKKDKFLDSIQQRASGSKFIEKKAKEIVNDPRWEMCRTKGVKLRLIRKTFKDISVSESEEIYNEAALAELDEQL